MKTIRLKNNGTPKEAMSFPAFNFLDLIEQSWETSALNATLEQKFFFVVYQFDNDDTLRFRKAMFWNMPYADRIVAQEAWVKTQNAIRKSMPEYFPRIADRQVVHVRPHGRDAQDTNLPDGRMYPRQGFWLNQDYIKDQITD